MQPSRGVPASTVMMAPTAAEDENAASRLANHSSARMAPAANPSAGDSAPCGSAGVGDNPARAIATRAATPSRPSDTSAATAPITYNGAPVTMPPNDATATTIAKHDAAVNVIAPQSDTRFASTAV